MYSLVNNEILGPNDFENTELINRLNYGNDFEKILNQKEPDINEILNFLRNLEKVILSNLTGSGSCCYAAFEDKRSAIQSMNQFKKKFPTIWCCIAENNFK